MTSPPHRSAVRLAGSDDSEVIGRLLDEFNREFGEPSPGPDRIARRVRQLMAGGDTIVLLGGPNPDGLALLRFRASLWIDALECYLAELYVVPEKRGMGLGRSLMEAAMDEARKRGAGYMDLNTGEGDLAAIALYESLGFSNREGKSEGPRNFYYEREL